MCAELLFAEKWLLQGNAQMSPLHAHPQFSLANTSFGCALCQHTPNVLIPCKHISPKHVIFTHFLEYLTKNHYQFDSSLNLVYLIMTDAAEITECAL